VKYPLKISELGKKVIRLRQSHLWRMLPSIRLLYSLSTVPVQRAVPEEPMATSTKIRSATLDGPRRIYPSRVERSHDGRHGTLPLPTSFQRSDQPRNTPMASG
jgi:hypothetical protein